MTGKQLKNAILQLAIQGKLVPQDPTEEPASVLLAKIRKEKEQFVKAGKLKKKDLATTPISDEEKPFEIPESWEWVNIPMIGVSQLGKTKNPNQHSGKSASYLCSINVYWDGINLDSLKEMLFDDSEIEKYTVKKGDLMICEGGDCGRAAIWTEDTSVLYQNALHRVRFFCSVNALYIKLCLYLYHSSGLLNDYIKGETIKHLVKGQLDAIPFPLPPIAEQHRIVSKIEELMPLVEEYGAAQEKLNHLNEALPEALKKSILQQAIQGKLVPQDTKDEPASALLAQIRKEKEQLLKAGKLKKKDLATTPIADDEKPFEIPGSWEWCRLGEIGIFERGNGIKRDETFSSGKPCVRYGEMYTKYRYNPTFDKTFSYTSPAVFNKCRKAHNGDLFMALTGENKQDIALAAQYTGNEEIAVGGDLCHFSILQAYALYFVYVINSQFFSDKKELLATGDIIVHISADKLGSIPIPLPPLPEQHRIVSKIEELMAMVDGMK